MRRYAFVIIGLIFIVLLYLQFMPDSSVFSDEEKMWLDSHSVIYYAPDPQYAPYEYFHEGVANGLVIDYLSELEKIIGIKIKILNTDSWSHALEMAVNDDAQFVIMTETEERKKHFNFTNQFIYSPNIMVINKKYNSTVNLEEINSYKYGVIDGYFSGQLFVETYKPNDYVVYGNIEEGLYALSEGKVDGFIVDYAQGMHYINVLAISDLSVEELTLYEEPFSFAVNKSNPELVGILNKALAQLDKGTVERINDKWFHTEYKFVLNSERTRAILIATFILALLIIGLGILTYVMRKIIHTKTKELKELNFDLEKRVYERTVQLEEANEELEISLRNLTETKNNLVQAEKFSSLGRIISGVAHEINTPLGNVITIMSYIENNFKSSLENREYIFQEEEGDLSNEIEFAIAQLVVIADIIDRFKQLEMTLIASEVGIFNFRDTIDESLSNLMLQGKVPDSFDVKVEVDKELYFSGSKFWIDEIVRNLLENAFEHSGLDKDTILLKAIDAEQNIEFSVEDHGRGVTSKDLNIIFEPFHKSSVSKGKIGLGLSIVYNIVVNNLKGEVEFISDPYKSTRIVMRFPKKMRDSVN